jgi:hypothetical protein
MAFLGMLPAGGGGFFVCGEGPSEEYMMRTGGDEGFLRRAASASLRNDYVQVNEMVVSEEIRT